MKASGGFKLSAVADLIPERRKALLNTWPQAREFDDFAALINAARGELDAVAIALPNDQHAPAATAALKAGLHVLCAAPPASDLKSARKIEQAAAKAGRTLLYAFPRRFGPAEQASRAAVDKAYLGDIYHARATWLRTRGIPIGTGWYTSQAHAGGGAMIDLGTQLLDLAWSLMGSPLPTTVYAIKHARFGNQLPAEFNSDVEDFATALITFEGGKTLELAAAWAINQPPQQQGTLCRLFGTDGGLDVYTPQGATVHRGFGSNGQSKPTALKPPKLIGFAALARHFRECVLGKAPPLVGPAQGVQLMAMIDAIYRSAASGKSVSL
jgi:predicted dehydrogenase